MDPFFYSKNASSKNKIAESPFDQLIIRSAKLAARAHL